MSMESSTTALLRTPAGPQRSHSPIGKVMSMRSTHAQKAPMRSALAKCCRLRHTGAGRLGHTQSAAQSVPWPQNILVHCIQTCMSAWCITPPLLHGAGRFLSRSMFISGAVESLNLRHKAALTLHLLLSDKHDTVYVNLCGYAGSGLWRRCTAYLRAAHCQRCRSSGLATRAPWRSCTQPLQHLAGLLAPR